MHDFYVAQYGLVLSVPVYYLTYSDAENISHGIIPLSLKTENKNSISLVEYL